MDERYVYAAVRYVERNPVRAGIVKKAEDYPWSSAGAHVLKAQNFILSDFYLLHEVDDWAGYLRQDDKEDDLSMLRRHGSVGRPVGHPEFVRRVRGKG